MNLDDDIKYAVNYYKDEKRGEAFSILLNLAELYLSIAGKMPEEKKLLWNGFSDDDIESKIFNLARQECILAFVKEKESIYLKGVEDGKAIVKETYEKYKHLDKCLSDKFWCGESLQAQMLNEFWEAIKQASNI